ncbi:conjugal transfer protein TrbE [Campylobacter sp. RM12640]|uniref:VirB4 family type IV secretion/conjugal transfer ATPase n=1 Tax=unclassified Campylobacter TaxID=2593542 RepID=UPI001DC77C25|nr:conjugal transfer protein TrbE [Campylobacter sp. RM12642]MBZ7982459.1 conjugal transfer protein TrbE [Campylobacter sp. RM12640]MBZ7989964.1 conjugal transfer protein TrbE [Campylobacter sp. RM12635]MBZ8008223.1 conjugal transfer protein TrbE [Campylobacter sp. RM9334]
MFLLKEFRNKAKAFSDILNYSTFIEDGVLLNKDGSLTAGFYYKASDISSITLNDRNTIATNINSILSRLGNGWVVHIDCSRTHSDSYLSGDTHYISEIANIIEEERKMYFKNTKHFENLFTIIFTYLPPHKNINKILNLMVEDDTAKNSNNQGVKILEYFKNTLNDLENSLSNFIDISRMREKILEDEFGNEYIFSDLLEFIHFCICGEIQNVMLPKVPMFLDCIIGAKEFITGFQPKIDNKYIATIAIEGFPAESYPNILKDLSELDFDYRFNTRFIFMDNYETQKSLNQYRRKWQQKTRGFIDQFLDRPSSKVDAHAVAMVNELDSAIADNNSGLTAFGYYTANIVIFDIDLESLEEKCKEIKLLLERLGFIARVENINAVEAYLGSLPAHVNANIRRPVINTLNLAHLMPLNSIWGGEKYNSNDKFPPKSPALMQVVTGSSTPFRLNLHVSDIGHTLIFGPTGAGKSVLLANLLLNFQKYQNAKVYAFDKGRSLYATTLATGGTHYNIASEGSKLAFAPLANIKTNTQIAWAESFIATCLELQNVELTPKHKKAIHEALESHIKTNSKSFTEFVSNLQDQELRDALHHYTISGPAGFLLDAEEDNLNLSNITTFEIEDLMNLGEQNIIPVLLYLFFKIEQSLDGSPTVVIIDEGWIALGHKVFKNKIVEWLKVLRKANCAVVLATQSLSDSAKSGILDVLQESCPTKIFLPNNEAFNKGSENTLGPYDFYKIFGLNDVQISIINNAIKKRDYYYVSPLGTRLFSLALQKINLAFTACSDKKSVQKIKELHEKYPNDWAFKFLDDKGINYKHYQIKGEKNE